MNDSAKDKILILGIDTPIGLTLVRELGRHGLEVHGVARSDRGVGLYSRRLSKGYILSGSREQQFPRLLHILHEENIPALMAISEVDLLWLDRHRKALAGIRLLIPDHRQLTVVLDKVRVYEAAERIGIVTPRTYQPVSPDSLSGEGLHYPVVMKWSDPNVMLPVLSGAGIPLAKFEYAYDENDLVAKLSRYTSVNTYPLVQEYCPGYGLGQMFLIHKGEVGLFFQHRRIHEYPPEGGFSSYCESLAPELHSDLREKSLALLRELDWECVAMVEYRHDPESGRSALMEINGRFWGSLPLSSYAGAKFAWQQYRLAVRGEAPAPLYAYQPKIRCAYMIPELKRLVTILFAPDRIQNRALRFSRLGELAGLLKIWGNPHTRYFVFRWSDPKPFVIDLLLAVRDLILRRS